MGGRVGSELHPVSQAQCFTEALLQDMAVPVLLEARSSDYGEVLERWHSEGDVMLEHLERDAFDWDHAEVGAVMASQWELPARLVSCIETHHRGDAAEPAVRLVGHLRESKPEIGMEHMRAAAVQFGIDEVAFDDMVDEAFEQADELAALLR